MSKTLFLLFVRSGKPMIFENKPRQKRFVEQGIGLSWFSGGSGNKIKGWFDWDGVNLPKVQMARKGHR